jgi:hypothetical protein
MAYETYTEIHQQASEHLLISNFYSAQYLQFMITDNAQLTGEVRWHVVLRVFAKRVTVNRIRV